MGIERVFSSSDDVDIVPPPEVWRGGGSKFTSTSSTRLHFSYYYFSNRSQPLCESDYKIATLLDRSKTDLLFQTLNIPKHLLYRYEFRSLPMPISRRISLLVPAFFMLIGGIFFYGFRVRAYEILLGKEIVVAELVN